MDAAEKGAERLRQAAASTGKAGGNKVNDALFKERFIETMDDDFGTPAAIAALFDLAREINRGSETGVDTGEAIQTFKELAGVLGLTLKQAEKPFTDAAPFIELLIKTRKQLRDAKQFKLADEIRDKLLAAGVTIEDTAQGTSWKRKK